MSWHFSRCGEWPWGVSWALPFNTLSVLVHDAGNGATTDAPRGVSMA